MSVWVALIRSQGVGWLVMRDVNHRFEAHEPLTAAAMSERHVGLGMRVHAGLDRATADPPKRSCHSGAPPDEGGELSGLSAELLAGKAVRSGEFMRASTAAETQRALRVAVELQ